MNFKLSNEIKNFIKKTESFQKTAYYDSVGVLTIGYGHTGSDVYKGQTITLEQGEILFDKDINKFALKVQTLIGNTSLNQNQFDAIVSFAYNVGTGNLKKSTLLKKIKSNPNDTSIRNEFLKWNKARKKVLPGLTKRRIAESNWYFGGGLDSNINLDDVDFQYNTTIPTINNMWKRSYDDFNPNIV